MGSGKTAIGRTLASYLSVPFLDSDASLEEAAALTISEIFERDGEAFFRAREAEVIKRLLSGPPAILSTGGGAFLNSKTRDVIDQHGVSVWLNADLLTLWERVRHKDTRPLLRTPDPFATLKSLYLERTPVYAKAHIHTQIGSNATIEDTTKMVIAKLREQTNLLETTP